MSLGRTDTLGPGAVWPLVRGAGKHSTLRPNSNTTMTGGSSEEGPIPSGVQGARLVPEDPSSRYHFDPSLESWRKGPALGAHSQSAHE